MTHPLLDVLLDAAQGRFPPVDGAVTFLPGLPDGNRAIVALTGHAFIAGDLVAADFGDIKLDGFGAAIVPATAVPTWLTGSFRRITVPQLPRRVVASIRRRRPAPSAPTHVALDTLRRVIVAQGADQPGVHPETAPLAPTRPTETTPCRQRALASGSGCVE